MMIDCDSCTVRGAACTDCVVTFLTIPVRPAAGRGTSAVDGMPAVGGMSPAGGPTSSGPPPSSRVESGRPAPGAGACVDLDDAECAAIDVLASSGLVPPLRMERAM